MSQWMEKIQQQKSGQKHLWYYIWFEIIGYPQNQDESNYLEFNIVEKNRLDLQRRRRKTYNE